MSEEVGGSANWFQHGEIGFGDNVRIVDDEITRRSGHAGLAGVCYGLTTPSVTGVDVVGEAADDVALNVDFGVDGLGNAWFAPNLVEFLDHAVGSRATVGTESFVKQADGSWQAERSGRRPATRRRRWFRRT